ncbi:hypothetical protein EHI48_16460 [Rhizobium sp. WSM1325]|jgi:hypothetical protein|nr:hypothetical protein EHI46_14300 [Rhizobium leguminosarum]RWY76100.1 hypothetical protein EHI48_16460 [Rhizobium leguminosarum]
MSACRRTRGTIPAALINYYFVREFLFAESGRAPFARVAAQQVVRGQPLAWPYRLRGKVIMPNRFVCDIRVAARLEFAALRHYLVMD